MGPAREVKHHEEPTTKFRRLKFHTWALKILPCTVFHPDISSEQSRRKHLIYHGLHQADQIYEEPGQLTWDCTHADNALPQEQGKLSEAHGVNTLLSNRAGGKTRTDDCATSGYKQPVEPNDTMTSCPCRWLSVKMC